MYWDAATWYSGVPSVMSVWCHDSVCVAISHRLCECRGASHTSHRPTLQPVSPSQIPVFWGLELHTRLVFYVFTAALLSSKCYTFRSIIHKLVRMCRTRESMKMATYTRCWLLRVLLCLFLHNMPVYFQCVGMTSYIWCLRVSPEPYQVFGAHQLEHPYVVGSVLAWKRRTY